MSSHGRSPQPRITRDQSVSLAGSLLVHLGLLGILSAIVLPAPQVQSGPAASLQGQLVDTQLAEPFSEELEVGVQGFGQSSGIAGSAAGPKLSMAVIPQSGASTLNVHAAALSRIDLQRQGIGGLNQVLAPGIGGTGNGQGTGEGMGQGEGGPGRTFFGLRSSKRRTMFVVDCSRSMNAPHPGVGKTRFGRVKLELLRTIGAMEETQQFYMIFFADKPVLMPTYRMVEATRDAKQSYLGWMANLPADGGTEPEAALLYALSLNPDIIYFLTDGQFDMSVVRKVTVANVHRIPIHTLGFGNDVGVKPLQDIASKNNGLYKFIPEDELPADAP